MKLLPIGTTFAFALTTMAILAFTSTRNPPINHNIPTPTPIVIPTAVPFARPITTPIPTATPVLPTPVSSAPVTLDKLAELRAGEYDGQMSLNGMTYVDEIAYVAEMAMQDPVIDSLRVSGVLGSISYNLTPQQLAAVSYTISEQKVSSEISEYLASSLSLSIEYGSTSPEVAPSISPMELYALRVPMNVNIHEALLYGEESPVRTDYDFSIMLASLVFMANDFHWGIILSGDTSQFWDADGFNPVLDKTNSLTISDFLSGDVGMNFAINLSYARATRNQLIAFIVDENEGTNRFSKDYKEWVSSEYVKTVNALEDKARKSQRAAEILTMDSEQSSDVRVVNMGEGLHSIEIKGYNHKPMRVSLNE